MAGSWLCDQTLPCPRGLLLALALKSNSVIAPTSLPGPQALPLFLSEDWKPCIELFPLPAGCSSLVAQPGWPHWTHCRVSLSSPTSVSLAFLVELQAYQNPGPPNLLRSKVPCSPQVGLEHWLSAFQQAREKEADILHDPRTHNSLTSIKVDAAYVWLISRLVRHTQVGVTQACLKER